jgi:hypothetical protein
MINNTNKNDKHPEWLFGINPNAIEEQEKQGQKDLCKSLQLPIEFCGWVENMKIETREIIINDATLKINDAKNIYERLGIQVLGISKNDSIFYNVVLPEGWKITYGDSSYWTYLLDDKNRKRGNIFIKQLFMIDPLILIF